MPLLPTGYQTVSYSERRLATVQQLRAGHDELANVTFEADTADGQILDAQVEQTTDLEEAVAAGYNRFDPDRVPDDSSAFAVARLRGVSPRDATYGEVYITVTLDATTTKAIGSIVAYPEGKPDETWSNVAVVESTTAGAYANQLFRCDVAGKVMGPASSLTQFVPTGGVNAVTNPGDAIPGRDADTAALTLYRSEGEMFARRSGSTEAIRARLLEVAGVVDARVTEDRVTHSVHAVVWDGDPHQATSDTIATALYEKVTPGIDTEGAEENTAVAPLVYRYDYAVELPIYVSATVTGTYDADAAKAAIAAEAPITIAGKVYYAKLLSALLKVTGVTDASLTLGTAPSPVGTTNIQPDEDEYATIDTANVVLA
jgi:hypothetical protein